MKRSGAQIVWEMLRHEGVEVVFGMPGGSIMTTYHPLQDYGIRHVLIRHELAAAHAADGYARVSGRVGVAMATSGPGATNLTTGIATAMMDSIPLVCITGQVASSTIGSDAFQESDITGITLPITKHNYLVTDVDELAETIHEAFYIAQTGRPGPVLIDLPKDVQCAVTDFAVPEDRVDLPGYHPDCMIDDAALDRAAERIESAKRPVILAGHGVVRAGAREELRLLAERMEMPVATTLLGKGSLSETHPLSLGMVGMHGAAPANHAVQEADLLLALGMRFDDRFTGCLERFAPHAAVVHVDLDVSEIGKNVPVDVAIVADVRDVLKGLLARASKASHVAWIERIEVLRADAKEHEVLEHTDSESLTAPHVIDEIWRQTGGKAIVVADVGQNQMWSSQYYRSDGVRPFVTSGGLGPMGFALPAAIGAQIAAPDAEVWVIAGDGGFQMNIQELATVVQEDLPLKMAVLNNGFLGMVRQWQEFFFDHRYESTRLLSPDFARVARAYDIAGERAGTQKESEDAIRAARSPKAGPALIEFAVTSEGDAGNVYPMVPPGAALHEMMRRPIAVGSKGQGAGR